MVRHRAEMNWSELILNLKERFLVSKVMLETNIMRQNDKNAERQGDMTHEATIYPSFPQLRCCQPVCTIPAPRRAPITV